jgi:hypothetical protein
VKTEYPFAKAPGLATSTGALSNLHCGGRRLPRGIPNTVPQGRTCWA